MTDTYTDDDARKMGVDPQDPRWIEMVKRARMVEENAPTVIPPCPEWCRLPEGHDYTGADGFGDDLTFERQHVAFEGKVADVSATESNRAGEVTVGPLEVFLDVRSDAYPVDVVRAVAAELLEAADVFERISR
jgi:hypothetical protein